MSTTSLNSILSSHQVSRGPHEVSCNLCGCNGASVRCVKCNSMAFCIGCDDMYHRHPKRRQHLRQAVALEYIQNLEKNPIEKPQPQQQVRNTPIQNNNVNRSMNGIEFAKNETKVLYPWRLTRTIPTIRVPDNFWAHPSKMPVPPPRRKKKTLSFAGIKDTFKRLVNPESNNNNKQQNEPIYATVQHNRPQNNGQIAKPETKTIRNNNQSIRPLPPTPVTDQLYENMRKFSLPNKDSFQMKSKEFASTNDLTRMSAGNIRENRFEQNRGSSLPRKNFSYQDLCIEPETDFAYQRAMMGSTQSVFPGVCGHPPIMSPMFFNPNCNPHAYCQCQQQHQKQWCTKCSHPIDPYNYYNLNSLTNSLEELTNDHNHRDDDLTDDECDDLDLQATRFQSHSAKNRMRRAKMKRSQSTYTMYGNNDCQTQPLMDYRFPNNQGYIENTIHPQTEQNNRKPFRQSSPTPSCRSIRSDRKSSERFRYPNSDISDSSSSSYSKRNKIKLKQQYSMENKEGTGNVTQQNDNDSEPEHEEIINDIGQWSCRFCTFLNDPDKNICEICCKTRLAPMKTPQPVVEQITKTRKVSIDTSNLQKSSLKKPALEPVNSKVDNPVESKEHEIIFDEKFIKEQIEIEKELQRRRENELRIAEENKKLDSDSKSNNQTNVETDDKKVEESRIKNEDKIKTNENKNDSNEQQSIVINDKKSNEKDHEMNQEKIVAKIIEEKINEQFGKLKIACSSDEKQQQSNDKPMNTLSLNNLATQPAQSNSNNYNEIRLVQPEQSINNQNNIQTRFNDNSPNGYHQFYPLQHQLNGQFNPMTQQWQHNVSPSGPFFHQRQSSNGSCNSSVYGGGSFSNVPINPLPPPNISPYYQQQNDVPRPIMNRNCSFDDLQSMSSVTSASLYYPPVDPIYHSQQQQSKLQNNTGLSGRQMIQILREAEKKGYSNDDLEAAIQFSPHAPLEWLEENWKNMSETVMTMANNQILEIERANGNKNLKFMMVNEKDAKAALRLCKGNIWQSVEKCVQRHQENKIFGTDPLKTMVPSKSKSFSMKVTGLGAGRANNDANYFDNNEDESEYDDYVDAENESVLNAEFLSEHSKLPMEEFLLSKEPVIDSEKDDLLNFYLQKIKNSKNADQINRNELEALIFNWQNEKARLNYEREQMKVMEKEKQKMQKIIDVQKRIGGYLSDGTTTEEELDREVARVFQNKIPDLDIESDRTPTFTNNGDIMEMVGPSNTIKGHFTKNINDNHELHQIKQRIESKLTELSVKTSEIFSPSEISVESIIIDPNSSETPTISQQQQQQQNEDVFVSPVSQISLSESDEQIVTVVQQTTSNLIAQKIIEPKPIKARIVMDKSDNFIGFIEKVRNIPQSFTGRPSVIARPIVSNTIVQNNQLPMFSSHVENVNHLQPMFTGNPIVKQTKANNLNSEKPPKPVTSKEISQMPELIKDSKPNEDRSRLNTKLSFSSKSLSLTELSSSMVDGENSILQKPVFSKLRGIDKLQRAHLLNSETNLPRMMMMNHEIRFDPQTNHHLPSFKLFKSESIESYLNDGDQLDRKERARNFIVNKLRSVESLNSSNSFSSESQLTNQSSSSVNVLTNQIGHSTQLSSNLLESANEHSSDSKNYERNLQNKSNISNIVEDYAYDFQWARTELECELCASTIPVQDIVVMITCTHFACRQCMKRYLTVQIKERQRLVITCPFCDQPDISAEQDEQVFEYLAIFDPFVRHIIDPDVYELYQRKVRDRALMRDPNFMWCIQCSSGFIIPNPKALAVICPDCRCIFCRSCKKKWKNQHLNLSCEKFAEWEMTNDIDYLEQQLNKHLKEFGIECPNCHFRYQLAKGGCMHFRCTQCSYDFCGGCSRPFKLGSRCFRAKVCERLGLHAHHPRNCLFYLRDKDIGDLQKLLDQNNIEYKTTVDGTDDGDNDNNNKRTVITRCQVMEQKEVDFVMKDKPCNRYVEMAGLCKMHYKEYLGNLIYQNNLDPIHIFTEGELELTLKRENIRIPSKIRGEDYMAKLRELILEKIPLDLK